LPESQKQEEEK